MNKQSFYIEGSYCCLLCQRTFNREIKLDKATYENHEVAHLTRFLYSMLTGDEFRKVFFQFYRDEITYSKLLKM